MSTPAPTLEQVERLVRHWLAVASDKPVSPAARRLAAVLKDPSGLEFAIRFIDRVIRPEDAQVAAASLQELARSTPGSLPRHLRFATRLGAAASSIAPGLVIPVVRRVLSRMVGHLLVDATDAPLAAAVHRIAARGARLNLNLLGETVLGQREAARRLSGVQALLARTDVDYVSVKISATVAPHSPWADDEAVADISESLLPLFRFAAKRQAAGIAKFVNLDMEEYRDLELTIAVFTALLDRPELRQLEAGIVLQAYLPDALAAMIRLQEWAATRRSQGGAAIKVRLVKGANLPMERVEAALHGWPLVTWSTKQETDTNYKRILDYALHADRIGNIRIGVAGHNLFDVAHAWLLAGSRGVREGIEFEMLLGMAEAQAEAVRETVGGLRFYVPTVHPAEFDVAIAYLVRRLEECASQENFMSAAFELDTDERLFQRERSRFAASLAALESADATAPAPQRQQDRREEDPLTAIAGNFHNAADTDPALPGNRAWARAILARVPTSTLGKDFVAQHTCLGRDDLEVIIHSAVSAGRSWGARSGRERAEVLHRAAAALEARRADLLEVMAAECGKTLDQGDPEVSEAVDFANYYANQAALLDLVDGATHVPVGLTVVAPPWNFPVAIPAGSTLAALAAGSAVILKPAAPARRTGSIMVQALWESGVPADVLRLVHLDEGDLGRQLVSDPRVDRLILTGAYETAERFRGFRADLPLLAETSGKNAIVITPHADLDLAVRDLVASAFSHAGQKCSAASLGILVGSVATSRRFREQLIDAVTSLRVGFPWDPAVQMGPLIEPAAGKLLSALTVLNPGERWLVEPRQLDDLGRLWSPGVKAGVRPGSSSHLTEFFGPVLGLVAAASLTEAIRVQNQVPYGLTAGLHTLDRTEVETWLAAVEAGNLYLNRGITGAIVRRQPFGGWKRSAVGAGAKAGGPHYLIGLSDWQPAPARAVGTPNSAVRRLLQEASAAGIRGDDLLRLTRAAGSDANAWTENFAPSDASGLGIERNVFRFLPVPVTVRVTSGGLADVVRVLAAGLAAGAPVSVSVAVPLPSAVAALVRESGATYLLQDAAAWAAVLTGDHPPTRVRLIGGDRSGFARESAGRPDIALYAGPVVESGRIELLTFLHEQSVTLTAHRFGSPTTLVADLPGL